MNSSQIDEAKADGKMSGLEETLRAYELNPFGQVDVCILNKEQQAGGMETLKDEAVYHNIAGDAFSIRDEAVARRDTNHTDDCAWDNLDIIGSGGEAPSEPWVGDTQTVKPTGFVARTVVIGECSFPGNTVVVNGAVSN